MSHKTIDTRRADEWPTSRSGARRLTRRLSQDGKQDTKGGREQ